MTDLALVRLDLDRKYSLCAWTRQSERIRDALGIMGIKVIGVEVRGTTKGMHVQLILDQPLESEVHLVALQAILGSDSNREALGLTRAGKMDNWNVLASSGRKGDFLDPTLQRKTTEAANDKAYQLLNILRKAGHTDATVITRGRL